MNLFHRNFCLLLFVPLLCLAAQEGPNHQHAGRVLDWSYRHLVVSGGLSPANLEAAKTGDFDNKYFGATPTAGHLFVCGTTGADTRAAFYWIGFTAYPTMNAATTGTITRSPAAGNPCTPITEIFNPNVNFGGGDHDIIISGVVGLNGVGFTNGVLRTDDISNGVITGTLSGVNYSGGVSHHLRRRQR